MTNTGGVPFEFTGALHSYLRVTQVEDVSLEGLYGHNYRDAANSDQIVRDSGIELTIDNEVDRVYYDIQRPQQLNAGNLSLTIESQGFPDVVVWNPWVELCAELKGARRWLRFEAAIRCDCLIPLFEPLILPGFE